MRMLKVFLVMLCVILVWGGLIWGINYIETYEPPRTPPEYNASEPVVDEEFVYKMAPIVKIPAEESNNGKTQLWFVIEFMKERYQFIGDSMPYEITHAETKASLDNRMFTGYVCFDIDANHVVDFAQWYNHDRRMYTFCVESNADIDFDDIVFEGIVHYLTKIGPDVYESVMFDFNADVSEITMNQLFVHDDTVFELDGRYYVRGNLGLDTVDYSVNADCLYDFIDIIPLNGTLDDLLVSLHDAKLAYGSGDDYLTDVVTPNGCELFFDTCNLGLIVGYRTLDGSPITDDMKSEIKSIFANTVIMIPISDDSISYIIEW